MWIVDLRQNRRAIKKETQRWVNIATAAQRTAEGRSAVVLNAETINRLPPAFSGENPAAMHLFMLMAATLVTETESGRKRLHHFDAATDVSFEAEQRPMAGLLLKLGCACQAIALPGKRHTLIRLQEATDIAGMRLAAGAVAAIDFDPLAVLPELRGLGLYPWEVMPIDGLGADGCHGPALDDIRLVVHLEEAWQPLRSGGFLAGVFVDSTYRDYRRQPPVGDVIRAYFTHGDRRPPRAVLAPGETPQSPPASPDSQAG